MIAMIAAAARNNVIGCGGGIPWDIPEDRAFFRKMTSGGIIIMGRRTYEDIGRPLPDRYNIVISQTKKFQGNSLQTAGSLEEALYIAENHSRESNCSKDIFLCGGQQIYVSGMRYAEKIYLTRIDADFEGDAFFPEIDTQQFYLSEQKKGLTPGVFFCVYERMKNKKNQKH